jgi:hypothetical protein
MGTRRTSTSASCGPRPGCGPRGLPQLSAGRIIHQAAISDETFFAPTTIATSASAPPDLLAAEALASVVRAARPATDWIDAIRLGLAGLLGHAAAHPEFGQVMFVRSSPPAPARSTAGCA